MLTHSLVQWHYDMTVPQESLAQRATDRGIALRRAHNKIKLDLLLAYGPMPGGTLIDLCCGRGGDIHKWAQVLGRTGHVLALDASPTALEEAQRRLTEALATVDNTTKKTNIHVPADTQFKRVPDVTDPWLWTRWLPDVPLANCITCFFALHYAWDCEARARAMLTNVAAKLQAGTGTFICTLLHWPAVVTRLGGKSSWDNALCHIELQPEPNWARHTGVGPMFTFQLRASNVLAAEACIEHAVRPETLCIWAKSAGLELLHGPLPFAELRAPNAGLSPDERDVSDLYAAWVFTRSATHTV